MVVKDKLLIRNYLKTHKNIHLKVQFRMEKTILLFLFIDFVLPGKINFRVIHQAQMSTRSDDVQRFNKLFYQAF